MNPERRLARQASQTVSSGFSERLYLKSHSREQEDPGSTSARHTYEHTVAHTRMLIYRPPSIQRNKGRGRGKGKGKGEKEMRRIKKAEASIFTYFLT